MWLLVVTLMQVCNETEQGEGQQETQNDSLRRKTTPGNLIWEPRLVPKEVRRIEGGLVPNGIRGVLPSRQGPTQPSFQTVKRTVLRGFLFLKNNKGELLPTDSRGQAPSRACVKPGRAVHTALALEWYAREGVMGSSSAVQESH